MTNSKGILIKIKQKSYIEVNLNMSSAERRSFCLCSMAKQAEPWWRASIWRSHRKVVIKQCSYHNNIIDIQNRLPYSKVVYPAIIALFSCLMEVNHGVRTGPNYPFRQIKSHFEVVLRYTCRLFTLKRNHMPRKVIKDTVKKYKYRLKRKEKIKVARRYFIKWKCFFVKISCKFL